MSNLLDRIRATEPSQAGADASVNAATLALCADFARRDGRPEDAAVLDTEAGEMRQAIDHLASAIILEGKSEKAIADKDVEKSEELLYESDFELNSMED